MEQSLCPGSFVQAFLYHTICSLLKEPNTWAQISSVITLRCLNAKCFEIADTELKIKQSRTQFKTWKQINIGKLIDNHVNSYSYTYLGYDGNIEHWVVGWWLHMADNNHSGIFKRDCLSATSSFVRTWNSWNKKNRILDSIVNLFMQRGIIIV